MSRGSAGGEDGGVRKVPFYVPLLDRLNPLVVALLHSPVHWIASAGLTTITLEGRRSGRIHTFPVGHHDVGDAIVVMVSNARQRSWWRNFGSPYPARLRLAGREVAVIGEVLSPDGGEFRERAEQAFRRAHVVAAVFDIDFDADRGLTPEQVKALADYAVIVRFTRTAEGE